MGIGVLGAAPKLLVDIEGSVYTKADPVAHVKSGGRGKSDYKLYPEY